MPKPTFQHLLPTRADKVVPDRHALVFGINSGTAGTNSAPAREFLRRAAELTFGLCQTFTLGEMFDKPAHDVNSLPAKEMARLVRANAPQVLELVAREKPRIIFQLGFSCETLAVETYGLALDGHAVQRPASTERLLVPYRMDSVPWIVMMHFGAKSYSHSDARAANDFGWKLLNGVAHD